MSDAYTFNICCGAAEFRRIVRIHTRRYYQPSVRVYMRVAGSAILTSVSAVSVTAHVAETGRNSEHFSTPATATPRPGATRECSSDADCNGELGETCVRLYDGCRRGQCMCNPAAGPPVRPPPTDGQRRWSPWDKPTAGSALGYCHHVTRMFDKLDAKCDLC